MRFAFVISTLVATALLGTTVASPIPPAKAYYTETDPAPEGSERADPYHGQKMERRATHQQAVHVDNGMDHSPVESAHEKEEGISKVAREFKFSTIHPSVVNSQNTACVKGDCSLSEVEETCLFNKNTHTGLPCTPKGATDTGKDRSNSEVNIDTDTKIITPASSANRVLQPAHRRRRAHHP
ncbi:hypothetical protein FRC04_007512 [Tulasnella sp. 424]|nr:hypothetical protein FRC04_007512 [Tulasnella sp. 424]KAG8975193.1 hypothetical protein FRC05_006361 [Tulasnella sp. 425]